jgi:phosphohistidine phosphatase
MHVKGDERFHKVLLILRHAKSSWKNKKLDDHDRPLNRRGRREAIEMGEYLKKTNMIPNAIVTSSATRAIETTTLVCRNCSYNKLVEVNFEFHRGGTSAYIHAISIAPNDKNILLIVGHNPDLEDLIKVITNRTIKLPTCTLIQINMNIKNWKSTAIYGSFKSEIVNIWRPKRID